MNISHQPSPKPTNTNLTTLTNKNNNNNNNNNNDKKVSNNNSNKKVIWDCGSSLYDSVELDSFRKQLDSAILNSSRTLSMPRQLPSEQPKKKNPSKFSRTFQKLLRSVFRGTKPHKNTAKDNTSSPDPWFFDSPLSSEDDDNNSNNNKGGEKVIKSSGKYFVVYDKKGGINGLSTIPEVNEVNVSPDVIGSSLVRKTMSARFTAVSRGIYCV